MSVATMELLVGVSFLYWGLNTFLRPKTWYAKQEIPLAGFIYACFSIDLHPITDRHACISFANLKSFLHVIRI